MRQYLDLCQRILDEGEVQYTRSGDTIGIFGAMMKFDLRKGFPILTTKKILWNTVVDELLWFIRGGDNINDVDAPKKIWDAWSNENGALGRIYGKQWRESRSPYGRFFTSGGVEQSKFVTHDQLRNAIDRIKKTPNSRRNIVDAWNVADIEEGHTNFPPCHVLFQFKVGGDRKRLDLAMFQRSADFCLGIPFNISSYSLLLLLVANECGLIPGIFTHFLADAHIYVNHIETLKKQLAREPRVLPTLLLLEDVGDNVPQGFKLPVGFNVTDVRKEHIRLLDYNPHGFLKYEVAV